MSILDATATAALIRAREISPEEVVEEAIARAEAMNPALNAIVEPAYDAARQSASRLTQRSLSDLPLAGVPMALKDLFSGLEGDTAYFGNRVLKSLDHRYAETSAVVRRFADAGAISLGRTHSPEFGYGNCTAAADTALYGPTFNPWALGHTAMGSSGGGAAAVAAGIIPIAHASDGGGSIRMPASACGLVGLKPSRGRVSSAPAGEVWSGGCSEGVLSRTVRDTALALDVLAGPEPGDPYGVPVQSPSYVEAIAAQSLPLTIGVAHGFSYTQTHPECQAAVDIASALLSRLGHHVYESMPSALDSLDYLYDYMVVIRTAIATELNALKRKLGREWSEEDMENGSWVQYQRGLRIPAVDFDVAIRGMQRWTREVVAWWHEGNDLLLLPTLATPPPETGFLTAGPEPQRRARLAATIPFTPPFNVTGQPAISLPVHWTPEGLPVGVQLVAAPGREDLLLQVGASLERELDWSAKLPPLLAGR